MTQEQVADCTGLTPVHVNRTLKALDCGGLIARTNRSVTIGNWNALANAGDFQSGYLHMRDFRLWLIAFAKHIFDVGGLVRDERIAQPRPAARINDKLGAPSVFGRFSSDVRPMRFSHNVLEVAAPFSTNHARVGRYQRRRRGRGGSALPGLMLDPGRPANTA
jgi:hypothetical protein